MAKKKAQKKKYSDQDIRNTQYRIDYVLKCKKEAEGANTERRAKLRELWNVYQNKQDYSNKMSWQSKCVAPKIFMQVEKASAEVKRALLQISKLFKFELIDDDLRKAITRVKFAIRKTIEPNMQLALRKLLEELKDKREEQRAIMAEDEREFKNELAKTNFVNIYSEMIKCAFLLGLGAPKVIWDNGEKQATFENTDIMNMSIPPNYLPFSNKAPRYLIEYKEMDLAELRKIATEVNAARKKGQKDDIYNMNEINKIEEEGALDPSKKAELRARRGVSDSTPVSKKVVIDEFWGDVISKDGKDIEENQLIMIANGKYVIRDHPNRFKHKKPPHQLTYALVYPHRGSAGISLVEANVKLLYVFNNILNMFVDNLNFSINKVYEVNTGAVLNPKNLTSIYPGKMIQKQTTERAVEEVMTSKVGMDALKGLQVLAREMQEGSAVTEFLMNMPSEKAKTLGEVQIKTAESRGFFDVIARDLEENSLKPLLEMTYDLYTQYRNFTARKGKYRIKVGGLSILLMQKDQVEKIGQVIAIASKNEQLAARTDIDDLWKKFLGIMNLSDVYVEPEESAIEQPRPEQIAAIEQKAAQDARSQVSRMDPRQLLTISPAAA